MNVIFWNALVNRRFMSRTVGPYKIAYWIRKQGYDAQVIEYVHLFPEDTLYKLTKHFITKETKILGISTTFFAWSTYKHSDGVERRMPESMLNVLKRIKAEFPHIKIVLGGYQSESLPSYGVIDATIMSYTSSSEEIFVEYLEHLVHGKQEPRKEIVTVDGVSRLFYNEASSVIYNIEKDNFKFTKQDCILPREPLPLDISRGCIFACRFCQYPHTGKKKYDYVRSMEYIEQEILSNYEQFGTTSYYLLDDTFNDTQQKLQEFHAMTKRLPFKINYTTYLRCDLIHRFPESTFLLKDSGLFGAFFGLESLHPEASKIISKAWSGKHAKQFVPELYHNIWNKEVIVHTNFIVGITKEPSQSIYETAKWFLDNQLHSIIFERLGLWGPGKNGRYAVKSEFDQNYEKYGYTLTYNDSEFPDWSTDYWTRTSAAEVTVKANEMVAAQQKTGAWPALTYMWQGIPKETLLNSLSTDVLKLAASNNSGNFLYQYYNMLLGK